MKQSYVRHCYLLIMVWLLLRLVVSYLVVFDLSPSRASEIRFLLHPTSLGNELNKCLAAFPCTRQAGARSCFLNGVEEYSASNPSALLASRFTGTDSGLWAWVVAAHDDTSHQTTSIHVDNVSVEVIIGGTELRFRQAEHRHARVRLEDCGSSLNARFANQVRKQGGEDARWEQAGICEGAGPLTTFARTGPFTEAVSTAEQTIELVRKSKVDESICVVFGAC